MYHQIKPTETFRERHLALLQEAENRRLGRRREGGDAQARSTLVATILALLVALALVGSLLLTQAARPARADGEIVFTVNSTADLADVDPGDLRCDADFAVGNLCTLRAAIQEANATPELDAIHFNIPGGGVQTIAPSRVLPTIAEPVVSTASGCSTPATL